MTKTMIRKWVILAGVTLSMATAVAQEEGCRVVRDDYEMLQVQLTAPALRVEALPTGYDMMTMEGYLPSTAVGAPTLPTFSALIEVPLNGGYEVTVSEAEYDTVAVATAAGRRLMPLQPSRSKSDTKPHALIVDEKVYGADAYYGAEEALVEAVGVWRDRNLARLQWSPVRYNAVQGTAIVCRKATVTVRYVHPDEAATKAMYSRYHTPAFRSDAGVINSLYPKSVTTSGVPVRYLIVAYSGFRGQLDNFVAWKERKGYMTDIVYTDDAAVGNTTASISAYLQSQYTNASATTPAPTYVLLVGDEGQLPAFTGTTSSEHITDLYYMTWTGGDNLPDCYYGRFSAQTVAQLTPQIDKTLMYEQYTFADPAFLDRAVMVAGVDGGTAGDYGYTHADPAMDYAITQYINGSTGYSQVRYFKNNTSIVPTGSNVTVASSESGNSATVRGYYNQGAGWINYSAHGSSTSWGTPNLTTSHVAAMTNTQKFGLMIGNCCLTNRFQTDECLGEALLRKGNYCGAVGYIGGSNSTYWYEDFYWAVGLRSSIGPTMSMAYMSTALGVYDRAFHTHGESESDWVATQGGMMQMGNMAVQSSTSSRKLYYWEIYHLMGDPSVMIYLTQADVMPLAVANAVISGTSTLTVSAAPYAYVTMRDTTTGVRIATAYADATGVVTLPLPASLTVGSYEVAASAQGYRTAFQTVMVLPPDGAYAMVTAMTGGEQVAAGSTAALSLTLHNPGNATAHNVTVTLATSDATVTLGGTTLTVDSLTAGGTVTLTGATATADAHAADMARVTVTATTTWTGNATGTSNMLFLTTVAPVLTLTASTTEAGVTSGGNGSVDVTLTNSGHAPLATSLMTLTTPTALLAASADNSNSFTLASGASVTRHYTLHADVLMPAALSLTAHAVVTTGGDTMATLPIDVFTGTVPTETFEGGYQLSGWTQGTLGWTVTSGTAYEGTYSARSTSAMSHNDTAVLSYTQTVAESDSLVFHYSVSSENNYDKFHFYLDGTELVVASGNVEWTRAAFAVAPGTHTYLFTYSKDYSVSSGSDCAWIDRVQLPHRSRPVAFRSDTLCAGSSYTLGGEPINTQQEGHYCRTLDLGGSLLVVDYTIVGTVDSTVSATACDSFTWNNREYSQTGTYADTVATAEGCTAVVTLELTIRPSSERTMHINACDHFIWSGTTYYDDAVIEEHYTNRWGCDSLLRIEVAVHPVYHDTVEATVEAESYTWNGSTYDASGVYEQTLHTMYGCDSVVTLVLTLEPPTQGIGDVEAGTPLPYPNPAVDVVRLGMQVERVTLYSIDGRQVGTWRDTDAVSLGSLPRGTYLMDIEPTDGQHVPCRIILQ